MADHTLHVANDPATRTLAGDLNAMRDRCERMEEALLSTDAILRTILSEGMIDHLPPKDDDRDAHNRAVQLLVCARSLVDRAVDTFMDEPPTIGLRDLLVAAREGRLQLEAAQ